jgi:hypothetical protein
MPMVIFLSWLRIDKVYVGCSELMDHWYPRLENFHASAYLSVSSVWVYLALQRKFQ